MNKRVVFATLMVLLGSACGENSAGSPDSPESTVTTTSPTTTTTTESADVPFAVSVNDAIQQINLQLPLLIEDEAFTILPEIISPDGTFGGPVTTDTEIRLIPDGNAFEPVSAVVVRATGTPGAVATPTRLLSGIGASLHALSTDAVDAFGRDALPHMSALNQTRTTITVGSYYDLTIVVVDLSNLTYIFTPVGVAPASDLS